MGRHLEPAVGRIDTRGGRVGHIDTIDPNLNDIVPGCSVAQRIPDRSGGDKTDSLDFGVILLVGMARKDNVHTPCLEQVDVLPALCMGKVEIILRLVDGFPDDRTVQEDKGIAAASSFSSQAHCSASASCTPSLMQFESMPMKAHPRSWNEKRS